MRDQKFADRAPTLWIHPLALEKIMSYIKLCPVEINGFAYVKRYDAKTIGLMSPDDVFITPQVVTMGSADVDATTVSTALAMATEAGRASEMRLQWHSHVNGPAYFSGTDMNTIDSYGDAGSQWMVSMVLNKRGDFSARLDMFAPMRAGVEMEVLQVVLDSDFDDQCRDDIMAMVQKLVMKPKPIKGFGGRVAAAASSFAQGTPVEPDDDVDDEPEFDLVPVLDDQPTTRVLTHA